ncbi:hypothetical protein Ae406Ps2_2159c [Pseudonocardia sp. Ae406_Ps2]|nr:hypothetical protein Ae406Ps2_2159c [Pseudonocardia sp. Ae406_Ps2]OLM06057.1 hypothetical protein Ae331Ps2_3767 [Pseudonocardia sp. Ae331_Ps2]OLM15291.1 hypothetical protein Ae505Ps2_5423c [Pseudonocardia sp. Ae505_Ps2]
MPGASGTTGPAEPFPEAPDHRVSGAICPSGTMDGLPAPRVAPGDGHVCPGPAGGAGRTEPAT